MRPATLINLHKSLDAHVAANNLDAKSNFYLKLNPKGKPLTDGTLLLEASDREGVLKRYYFMPDSHGLHKIVVERVPRVPKAGTVRGGNNPFYSR
jgi:hypothetical protein